MFRRNRALRPRSFAVAVCCLLLMAPALWNGFPLLQYDTGGYLARWYEGYLVPSRSAFYGLVLFAGVPLAFWPVLLLQSALTVWIVDLMLRVHGLGKRPLLLTGIVAALTVATTLPWLTAILLTDIFCGLGVLALYLLLLRGDALSRAEQYGLIGLVAAAGATHNATLAVLLALVAAAACVSTIDRRIPFASLRRGVLALALSAVLVLGAGLIVTKHLAWTPGGFALSFGRMLQDGIVKKYLDERCPNPALRLCAYKDRLPTDADVWFWGSSIFDELGRFAGLRHEMQKIVVESLVAYPALQARTAIVATARQLLDVHTGEGVIDSLWHTYGIVEKFTPQLIPAMRAARQQRGELSFVIINSLQYPLALIAMALLPVIVAAARRKALPPALGELAAAVIIALIANAFICGAFSNPHDRYGARMAWLAGFTVLLALAALARDRLGRPSKIA